MNLYKEYFHLSKEYYLIGNLELMVDKTYKEKVKRQNEIFYRLREIEKLI